RRSSLGRWKLARNGCPERRQNDSCASGCSRCSVAIGRRDHPWRGPPESRNRKNQWRRRIPLLVRRGGCEADGVVAHTVTLLVSDHPVCGAKVGFADIFLMP